MPTPVQLTEQSNIDQPSGISGWSAVGLRLALYLSLLILLVVTAVRLANALQISFEWLGYRPDSYWRPGSEGLVLDETLRIRQGLPIYNPITPTSFISGPYPPVFYYLSAFLINFTGENMLAGRLISFTAALGSALLIALLVIRENHPSNSLRASNTSTQIQNSKLKTQNSKLIALVAGAALLTTPPFLIWASRNRADMLMVFFALAGCYALLGWNPARSQRYAYLLPVLSIICFGLACYTKQTALVAPAAAALWLLLRHPKIGLLYSAGLAAGLLLPFLTLEIITRHEFYRHIISYHALPWSWPDTVNWFKVFASDNFWWLIAALGWILVSFFLFFKNRFVSLSGNKFSKTQLPQLPFSIIFCAATLLGTISIGVKGGDHNHLLLPAAGICWAAASALTKLLAQPESWLKLAAIALSLVLASQLWFGWDERLNYYGFDLNLPSPATQARLDGILKYVRNVEGPILSEEVALPALSGKSVEYVEYNDVFTMGALAATGKWQPQELAAQIRQKHFSLILLPLDLERTEPSSRNIWPPELLQAIRESYYVKFRDVWFIYEPRP